MTITALGDGDRSDILALLDASHLPVSDLAEARPVFLGVRDDHGLAGVVAVEPMGRVGLLRSLAVRQDRRGTGLGTRLAEAAEQWAKEAGIREIYLLTATAEIFFARRSYQVMPRDQVDAAIQTTTEFAGTCPASALVMHRRLS